MQPKLCGMCKKEKAIECFSPDSFTNSGWRWACKECEKIRRKTSYERNRKKRIASTVNWKKRNKEKHLAYIKKYRTETRNRVFEIYGQECVCCKESRIEFLTIDHINRDGAKHRKTLGSLGSYRQMMKQIDKSKYRTMCMNCNWAIRHGGICPHKQRSRAILAKVQS